MTEMIYAIGVLLIAAGSFFCGLKLSDKYHESAEYETKVALEKQFARLMAGVDADDTGQPYVSVPPKRFAASKEFVDRFQTNGSATMAVDRNKHIG